MSTFSDFQLEQFVLNELDPNQTALIEQQLYTDKALFDRINDIKLSNNEVLSKMPVDAFIKNNGLGKKPTLLSQVIHNLIGFIKKPAFSAGFMATLSITFAVLFLPDQLNQTTSVSVYSTADTVRVKGLSASLKIYKKQGEHISVNEPLKQNDILQLAYIAGADQYGYIFSIDGNGVLTEHLADDQQSFKLNNNGEISLDFAYQLDDAPEFERFIFISSESAFNTQAIKQQAMQLIANHQSQFAPLVIKSDHQQYSVNSITLHKQEGAK